VVKAYDSRRGLGEISRVDGGADVAVFVSEVERAGLANLVIGQRLSFAVQSDPQRKRRFAVRLELIRQ
jgi:CspA family cold shock protein